ncbi:MAG TPA: hypothetical protein VHS35_00245 [Pseudonocardia sp.]|nr:hypothetical protein [Pseudonocardia sp.]
MTAAHLMTRGTPRRLDYRFLGAGPAQRWWRPVQDWVVLEQPEVIACGRSLLISGIPSARRDAIGTAIRYTLVVEDVERALAHSLAAAGLHSAGRARLGELLDAGFPAEWVDAALGDTAPSDAEVARRLAPALAAFGVDEPAAAQHRVRHRSWVGALDDGQAVAAFLDRVTRLAEGEPGWAFTTSAIASVKGAGDAADALGAPVAVLLADGGPPEVVDLGKAQAGPRPGIRTMTTTTPSRRRWLVPLAVVVLLAAILVVVLIATVFPL